MRRSPRFDKSSAFSLIEILAVVTIAGLLTALLLGGLQRVRHEADQARCASNLRQIGLAIQGYTAENSMTLPGPLWSAHQAVYSTNDTGQLLYFIAPYLGLPAPTSKVQQAPIMFCPAWRQIINDPNGRAYAVNLSVDTTDGKKIGPFGYPSTVGTDGQPKPPAAPLKVTSIKSLSASYALQDMDQAGTPSYVGNASVPLKPVHINVRNTLYLDGHVGAVAVQ